MTRSPLQGWLWLLIMAALWLASCGRVVGQASGAQATNASLVAISSDTCPITQPPHPPFVPSAPYRAIPAGGGSWYGTPALWTYLPPSGTWEGLPYHDGSYSQKVFWWRQAYDWQGEPLTVSGRRLDKAAAPLEASTATNAFADDIGSAILVGVGVPTTGCWQITGRLKGSQLTFVVRVIGAID